MEAFAFDTIIRIIQEENVLARTYISRASLPFTGLLQLLP